MSIDPRIAGLVLDATKELASWAWNRATGRGGDEDVLAAIKRKVLEAALEAAEIEIETQAALHGITLLVGKLELATADAVKAFEVAATVKPLFVEVNGADGWIELVPTSVPDDEPEG